tara:strand:- start:182 stop:931 length:750 start_codon:yes stop_codon:yes gene_type:complete
MLHLVSLTASSAMLAADPCGLPELPSGRKLQLQQTSWDDAGTGGVVWPAARALCRWQAGVADELAGARVLELGAGTGACGLFAAGLGASHVSLTDGGPPGVVALAEANIERNRPLFAAGATASAERLLWGEGQPLPAEPLDFVLASDCTYHEQTRAPLCFTLRQLLLRDKPPRVILTQTRRDGPAAIEHFLEVASSFGLGAASTIEAQEPKDGNEGDESVGVTILELRVEGDAAEGAAESAVSDPRFVF